VTGDPVTGPAGRPTDAEPDIGSYLAAVASGLTGPARTRRDILAELGAGVADAADAHRRAGLDAARAARAAIAEFGSPDQVAAGFRAELAAAQARRTALTLMTVGPLTGMLWLAAALASHIGRLAPPWEWAGLPAGARLATHLAAIALAAAIGTTLFTLAATGRLNRWLPTRPASSAAIAAGSLAAADIAILAALVILATATPSRLAALPLAAVGTASLTRLSLAARAARNCLSAPHTRRPTANPA
jgi:hypothetical protein